MLYGTYIKTGLFIVLVCGVFFAGWHTRDRDFTIYKDQVRIEAEKAQAHIESIQAQHELINQGIKNEYEGKLAAVKSFYSRVQLNPSSGPMSSISPAPKGTDAETAYPILAGQCAETTLQLIDLQKWMLEIQGIK